MKNLTVFQQSNPISLTLALVSVLSFATPVQSVQAETNTLTQDCQQSSRGTRCKAIQPDTVTAQINRSTVTNQLICQKSARGTGCQNQIEHVIIAENFLSPDQDFATSCLPTVRGTRNCSI